MNDLEVIDKQVIKVNSLINGELKLIISDIVEKEFKNHKNQEISLKIAQAIKTFLRKFMDDKSKKLLLNDL